LVVVVGTAAGAAAGAGGARWDVRPLRPAAGALHCVVVLALQRGAGVAAPTGCVRWCLAPVACVCAADNNHNVAGKRGRTHAAAAVHQRCGCGRGGVRKWVVGCQRVGLVRGGWAADRVGR
jgi:hypothetical protein